MVAEKLTDNLDQQQEVLGGLFDLEDVDKSSEKLNPLLDTLLTDIVGNAGEFEDGEKKPDGTGVPACLQGKEKLYFHSINSADGNCRIYCREDGVLVIDAGTECTEIRWNPKKQISSKSDYKVTVYKAKTDRPPQTNEDYESRELDNISPDKVLKLVGYCRVTVSEAKAKQQESQDQAKITQLTESL